MLPLADADLESVADFSSELFVTVVDEGANENDGTVGKPFVDD